MDEPNQNVVLEKNLSLMNRGAMASIILTEIKPILVELEDQVKAKIRQAFRAASATEAKMLAFAAELCTLEDIENKLIQRIKASERNSGDKR